MIRRTIDVNPELTISYEINKDECRLLNINMPGKPNHEKAAREIEQNIFGVSALLHELHMAWRAVTGQQFGDLRIKLQDSDGQLVQTIEMHLITEAGGENDSKGS